MPKQNRSRQGGGKSARKSPKKPPRKRKNPRRRQGAFQAWKTRRAKYGPTGMPRKRRGEKKGSVAKSKSKRPQERKRRGEAKKPQKAKTQKKRRGRPYEGSALQRYNLARAATRSRGRYYDTRAGTATPYLQQLRERHERQRAYERVFAPEDVKAHAEAAEQARWG